MTKKELIRLLKECRDLETVENKLVALGYFKCDNKDGFRDINLVNLYAGNKKDQKETRAYKTSTPLLWYDGEIVTNSPAKKGYEFVLLTRYKERDKKWYRHGNLFPCNFRAYAKACEV